MLRTYKPVSPGIRFRKSLVKDVECVRPKKGLTSSIKGHSGRSRGRVSSAHKQRGSKKHYRIIDFKRDKIGIQGKVSRIEHDPNRGPNIALINYLDGEKRYILAPEGLMAGMMVESSDTAPYNAGNCLPLESIPLGSFIHNVELNPGAGGIIARGAGNSAQVVAKEGNYVTVKLPSGEVKKIQGKCRASLGVLSNIETRNIRAGKAGRKRHQGWRPHVRGVAMPDPGKHPHAGSYNSSGIGMSSPKSPWGWKTRGVKTRKRSKTDYTLVSRRNKK